MKESFSWLRNRLIKLFSWRATEKKPEFLDLLASYDANIAVVKEKLNDIKVILARIGAEREYVTSEIRVELNKIDRYESQLSSSSKESSEEFNSEYEKLKTLAAKQAFSKAKRLDSLDAYYSFVKGAYDEINDAFKTLCEEKEKVTTRYKIALAKEKIYDIEACFQGENMNNFVDNIKQLEAKLEALLEINSENYRWEGKMRNIMSPENWTV